MGRTHQKRKLSKGDSEKQSPSSIKKTKLLETAAANVVANSNFTTVSDNNGENGNQVSWDRTSGTLRQRPTPTTAGSCSPETEDNEVQESSDEGDVSEYEDEGPGDAYNEDEPNEKEVALESTEVRAPGKNKGIKPKAKAKAKAKGEDSPTNPVTGEPWLKDPDLEGPMNKYLQGSVDPRTVLVIKWHRYNGMSFQKCADEYTKYHKTPKNTCSWQAIHKRYKKGITQFEAEFPEVKDWENQPKKGRALNRERAGLPNVRPTVAPKIGPKENNASQANEATSGVGPNNRLALSCSPELKDPRPAAPELRQFWYSMGQYKVTLRMQAADGSGYFDSLVPENARPHRTSNSGVVMSVENLEMAVFGVSEIRGLNVKPVYTVSEPLVRKVTLGRYAQCVGMDRRTLPTHDIEFEIGLGLRANYVIQDSVTSKLIEWTVRNEMELYCLASSFGNDRVCDLILDKWKGFAHDAGLDQAVADQDIVYLFTHLNPGHPALEFWADVFKSRGWVLFVQEEICNLRKVTDSNVVATSLNRVLEEAANEFCSRYHLHARFRAPCYRECGHGCGIDPDWVIYEQFEDWVEDIETELDEELYRIQASRRLTEADIQNSERKKEAAIAELRSRTPLAGKSRRI